MVAFMPVSIAANCIDDIAMIASSHCIGKNLRQILPRTRPSRFFGMRSEPGDGRFRDEQSASFRTLLPNADFDALVLKLHILMDGRISGLRHAVQPFANRSGARNITAHLPWQPAQDPIRCWNSSKDFASKTRSNHRSRTATSVAPRMRVANSSGMLMRYWRSRARISISCRASR